MKYKVLMTIGGCVRYDGMTGEPCGIKQVNCPTEVLGTFESKEEAREFLDDYVWGRTNLPYKEGNKSFKIEEVKE